MAEAKPNPISYVDGIETANKAIAQLAVRVAKLEAQAPAIGKVFYSSKLYHHHAAKSMCPV